MYPYLLIFFSIICIYSSSFAQKESEPKTPFEKSGGKKTATYEEMIDYYKTLANKFGEIKVLNEGTTDVGKPLKVVIVSGLKIFDPIEVRKRNKLVFFINNAIHPGEPEGVDACMMLVRDLLTNPEKKKLLDKMVLVIIPMYNIDGVLNRGCCSRIGQDGPDEYGFRGNAQNRDLNRDFMKADTRNAQTFQQVFQQWSPDFFIDTHTTNGADYQYTITLIATQHVKSNTPLGKYIKESLTPEIYKQMQGKKWDLAPYVVTRGRTPETGIVGFMDTPRYSRGYSALYNTIGFVTETHMIKAFDQRVKATYDCLEVIMNQASKDAAKIASLRNQANKTDLEKKTFYINYELDTTRADTLLFKGYEPTYVISGISGKERLKYDKDKPYEKPIPFYDYYLPIDSITKPFAYIIPQAYYHVLEALDANSVEMYQLTKDTTVNVEIYYIDSFKTVNSCYEGHYMHYNTKTRTVNLPMKYYKGDFVVLLNQRHNNYLIEALEPRCPDSFFNWNYFDGILMQKEGFSDYLFEDIAAEILNSNETIRAEFQQKKDNDHKFADNHQAQLAFIYYKSNFYEKSHNRYPVGRILSKIHLPIE